MTVEHLRPSFERDRDSLLFCEVAVEISRGNAPSVFWDAVRLGQVTALVKPDGVRCCWGRPQAGHCKNHCTVQSATCPHQFALKTRAGTVRVPRSADPRRIGCEPL